MNIYLFGNFIQNAVPNICSVTPGNNHLPTVRQASCAFMGDVPPRNASDSASFFCFFVGTVCCSMIQQGKKRQSLFPLRPAVWQKIMEQGPEARAQVSANRWSAPSESRRLAYPESRKLAYPESRKLAYLRVLAFIVGCGPLDTRGSRGYD